jgi:hypothetical protein
MNRNLAGKIRIQLASNGRQKRFDGYSYAITAHVDCTDCKSQALEWPIFYFRFAIRCT